MREYAGKVEFTDCTVKHVTPRGGVLVYINDPDYEDGDAIEVWLAQEMIDDDSEVYAAGQSGKLVISAETAMKKGLI